MILSARSAFVPSLKRPYTRRASSQARLQTQAGMLGTVHDGGEQPVSYGPHRPYGHGGLCPTSACESRLASNIRSLANRPPSVQARVIWTLRLRGIRYAEYTRTRMPTSSLEELKGHISAGEYTINSGEL